MAQIKTGTIAVTNGETRVIGSVNADWSAELRGDTPANTNWLSLIGSPTVYQVADIFPPGTTGNTTTDRWELVLSALVSDPDDAEALYVLHWWFTVNKKLPLLVPGDEQTAQIWNKAMQSLDATTEGTEDTGSKVNYHEKAITGGDVSAQRIFMPFPSALGAPASWIGKPWFKKQDQNDDNVEALTYDSDDENGYYVNLSAPAIAGQILKGQYIR